MTTTVNRPGFSWDDEPNTTISPIKAKPEPNNDGGWGDDEPEKASAPARRQFKTNELPLSSATRMAVEGLSHKFKKKGGFDAIRKQVWGQLEESEFEKELVEKVKAVAISTLESNPSLLSQTTKKSRPLLEGHIERSNVYHDAESHISALVRAHVESSMEPQIRALRVAEAGEEKARIEQQLGAKTAEEYEEDLELRRTERREVREIERQQKEEEQKKEREQREKERKRLNKIEDDKREKERQERKIARDLQRKRQSEELARAHAGEKTSANTIVVDSHERGRYDDRGSRGRGRGSGSRGRGGSGGRGRGSRENSRGRRRPSVIPKVENLTPEDQERYDRLAMDALVRDGKKVQRNRYQAEPEIDETLAPPKRKAMPSSAIKPIDRDPPPVKKELIKNIKIEDRDTKSDRPPSRFDIKLNDLDRRDKPRERSRDRGYPRRGSVDRGGRSRRSSRDRLDRIDRHRSRSGEDRRRAYDDRDRDPPRRSARDSKDFKDSVIRTQREKYARPRSHVRDRDTHTRRRSRSPLRSPLRKPSESLARSASITDTKPILPIDLARDPVLGIKHGEPTGRKYIDYEAEERKYIETKKREVEAAKFTQLRKEAKEKGLPMPGYDQREIYDRARESRDSMERHESGTPGLGRGDSTGGRPEWRQSAPNGGFAIPVARDNSGGAGRGRGRSIGRPPSRDGLVFRSRENTPAPAVGGRRRESATGNQNRTLMDIALEARDRRSATPATANVKTESNVRAATLQVNQGNNVKTEQPSPALTRHSRRDSTEAGEIVAGVPEGAPVSRFDGGGSVRRKSYSRSRDRRDRRDEKPRADSRERRRRDERDDRRDTRDDRRDSRRDDTRDRRDDRDRRPRSRSRDRDRRYRSRSRDSRRPRDSGRNFGGRR